MIVAAVDDGDVDRRLAQSDRRVEAAEAGAEDDHMRPARRSSRRPAAIAARSGVTPASSIGCCNMVRPGGRTGGARYGRAIRRRRRAQRSAAAATPTADARPSVSGNTKIWIVATTPSSISAPRRDEQAEEQQHRAGDLGGGRKRRRDCRVEDREPVLHGEELQRHRPGGQLALRRLPEHMRDAMRAASWTSDSGMRSASPSALS